MATCRYLHSGAIGNGTGRKRGMILISYAHNDLLVRGIFKNRTRGPFHVLNEHCAPLRTWFSLQGKVQVFLAAGRPLVASFIGGLISNGLKSSRTNKNFQ